MVVALEEELLLVRHFVGVFVINDDGVDLKLLRLVLVLRMIPKVNAAVVVVVVVAVVVVMQLDCNNMNSSNNNV